MILHSVSWNTTETDVPLDFELKMIKRANNHNKNAQVQSNINCANHKSTMWLKDYIFEASTQEIFIS